MPFAMLCWSLGSCHCAFRASRPSALSGGRCRELWALEAGSEGGGGFRDRVGSGMNSHGVDLPRVADVRQDLLCLFCPLVKQAHQ